MAITNKEILEEVEKLKKMIPTANGDFILMKKTVEDLMWVMFKELTDMK